MDLMDAGGSGPVFFAPNRVWRCYTGGALLDRFRGVRPERDGHEPEEWLASTVRAVNGVHSRGPDEGLACVATASGGQQLFIDLLKGEGARILGAPHVARHGTDLGVLCKYLDSAVRLPIQCHPDATIAQALYHSRHGKTECWFIVNTRRIGGEDPYLLVGFKPGVTAESFRQAAQAQDTALMTAMLHRIQCQPGEMYFIPGRMPHAIGPGVFMVETQEPSDWVVQPESRCADTCLTPDDMWGPLTPEQALAVFDYTPMDREETLRRIRPTPRVVSRGPGCEAFALIGAEHTQAFAVMSMSVHGACPLTIPRSFGVIVVVQGDGELRWPAGKRRVCAGDYFLLPFSLSQGDCEVTGSDLNLLICLPPVA